MLGSVGQPAIVTDLLRAERHMWKDEGYHKPKGADERRVEDIANTYKRVKDADREGVRKELKKLIADGELRPGYKDRAGRLRLRLKK